MGSAGRLLVLALLVTADAARTRRSGHQDQEEAPPNLSETIEKLQGFGCLPDDFTSPVLSHCEAHQKTDKSTTYIQCAAESLSIASDVGFNQSAGEAFIESLSYDQKWTAEQKEVLNKCNYMMNPELPADMQGGYMLICWLKMLMFRCGTDRIANVTEVVSPEDGRELTEAIASMAEGDCVSRGLANFPVIETFTLCGRRAALNMTVLGLSVYSYTIQALSDNITPASAVQVAAVREQLGKFNDTVYCMMKEVGELYDNNTVNYDQVVKNLDDSLGPLWLKSVATSATDFCEDEGQLASQEYLDCWNDILPYACNSIESHTYVWPSFKSAEEETAAEAERHPPKA